VLHGELFEQRFEALRRKRQRNDGSKGRPFSGMHKVILERLPPHAQRDSANFQSVCSTMHCCQGTGGDGLGLHSGRRKFPAADLHGILKHQAGMIALK